jgi:plasmid stabilization system protein ParE
VALKKNANTLIWSPKALKSYNAILDYIGEKFSEVEIQKFVRRTVGILELISHSPTMFRLSEKGKHKHIVVISKQTTLYYRFKPNKKEVELLLFSDTRQDPKRLRY